MPGRGSQAYLEAMSRQNPWRLDPTRDQQIAEERDQTSARILQALAHGSDSVVGSIQEQGRSTAEGIRQAAQNYRDAQQRAKQNELADAQNKRAEAADLRSQQEFEQKQKAAQAEEDWLNAPADGSGAPAPYAAPDGQGPVLAEEDLTAQKTGMERPAMTNRQMLNQIKMQKAQAELSQMQTKGQGRWEHTSQTTPDGHPVLYNKATGE